MDNKKTVKEGLIDKLIYALWQPKVDKILKDISKEIKNDQELKDSLESYHYHKKNAIQKLSGYCKNYPWSDICKDYKSKIRNM